MRLHDIISRYFLPRFADAAAWEQNALDGVIKDVRAASYGLGAPFTMKAIEALSDADLMAWFDYLGIAIYYPDLTRKTRNDMLFEMSKNYRYLGTPYAVELLCKYIFDEDERVDIEIHDNIAWDSDGELIDEELLDLFDVYINIGYPEYDPNKSKRIIDNIFKFCRNSQTLRDIVYFIPGEVSQKIGVVQGEDVWYCVTIVNETVATPIPGPIVLPAVNNDAGAVATYPNHADFASNVIKEGRVWGSGGWIISTYDNTKTYATINWHAENSFDGFRGVEISEYNGHLGVTNVLPFAIPRYIESVFATCDSLDVSVITVYDASNIEYNAFLYSANGHNYYYVLDFVQNDWTEDLSGIGYSLTPNIAGTFRLAVSLDANNEPEADIFESSGWYWWSRVPDDATKNALDAEGLWLNSGYPFGSAKYSSGGKTLVLVGVFTDAAGTVLAPGWNRAFDLVNNAGAAALRTPNFGYPTAVKTYRVKIAQ